MLPHGRLQCLIKIVDNVAAFFKTNRKTDQIFTDARSMQGHAIQLLVGRAGGMNNQCFGITHICQMRYQT